MKKKLGYLVLFLATVTIAIPSFGDTIQGVTVGGISFVADLNANTTTHTYTLTLGGQNTLSTSATLNAFALQLFGNGSNGDFTISTGPSITNWTFEDGAKINNSGPGCNTSNGAAGWLCGTADTTGHAITLAGGGSFNWTFTGTFASSAVPLSQFDLMANGTSGADGGKWAYSDNLIAVQVPAVPEPSSFLLIASGLTGIASFIRRRTK